MSVGVDSIGSVAMPLNDVSILLLELGRGRPGAMDRLLPLIYEELRKLAHHHRRGWGGTALGTTSLVHEAYLKLVEQTQVDWQSRAQFFYIASCAMRSLLIDNARRLGRQKRGGGQEKVALEEVHLVSESRAEALLVIDQALGRLQAADAELARVVECRFFGGLSTEETSEALGLSPSTVKRRWNLARAWLFRELNLERPKSRLNR